MPPSGSRSTSEIPVHLAAEPHGEAVAHRLLDLMGELPKLLPVVVPPFTAPLVGRRDHCRAAVGSRQPAERDGLLQAAGAVVDAGQDMAVQVDHRSARHQAAEPPAFVASPSSAP
jgi:hypothetical protein